MQPSLFVLGSAACAMKALGLASSLPWGRWGGGPRALSFQTRLPSLLQALDLSCTGAGVSPSMALAPAAVAAAAAAAAAVAAVVAVAAGRAGGGRTSSGGGSCWRRGECWRSGGGRGFLPENRVEAGFPPPSPQSSRARERASESASVLLQDGPPASPAPLGFRAAPGQPGARSHLLHHRGAEVDSSRRRRPPLLSLARSLARSLGSARLGCARLRGAAKGAGSQGGAGPGGGQGQRRAGVLPDLVLLLPRPSPKYERSPRLPDLAGRRS
jgi:hypothetical protein